MHWILCHHKIFSYTAGIIRHYHKSAKLGLIQSIVNNSSDTLQYSKKSYKKLPTYLLLLFEKEPHIGMTIQVHSFSVLILPYYPYNWQVDCSFLVCPKPTSSTIPHIFHTYVYNIWHKSWLKSYKNYTNIDNKLSLCKLRKSNKN